MMRRDVRRARSVWVRNSDRLWELHAELYPRSHKRAIVFGALLTNLATVILMFILAVIEYVKAS
jgi:hypothetical protein